MQFLSRHLGRWPLAFAWVLVLSAAVLLPGLSSFGLWEPQERQLADKIAPGAELAKKQAATPQPAPVPPKDGCYRIAPTDQVSRTLTQRAMKWGRDTVGDSDAGRRLPLALLGLLTVLATAGIAMRKAGPRAGVVTALVLLSMPLLVFQSRQLTSEIGTAAGAAMTMYGFVAIGSSRGVLGIVESVVGAIALVFGVVIGFVAGGALLGVLVPVGAYAAAHGLGAMGLVAAAKTSGSLAVKAGGKLRLRIAAGRSVEDVRLKRVIAWIEVFVGLALVCANLIFGMMAATDASTTFGVIAISTVLLVHGALVLSGDQAGIHIDQVKGFVAALFAIGVLSVLIYQVFSAVEPQPGLNPPQRAVLGKAIVATGCWSTALGGLWRPEDDLRYSFDSTFELIAYGTFPWGILAPIAMAALIAAPDRDRRIVGGIALAWGAGAWIANEVFQRKVGFTIYAGFPALALAVGVWLDGLLRGFSERLEEREHDKRFPIGGVLVGLFVAFAVIDLGKDLQSFPERISSLLVGADQIAYPKMSRLLFLPTKLWILVLGALVALGFAVAMGVPRKIWLRDDVRAQRMQWAARIGLAAALGGTALLAAFWSFAWQPALATNLSSKAMFDTYVELRKQGDQLVIMGDMGDAPNAYAPGSKPEQVSTRDQIVAALARPNRVFAIAPQTELCQLHREVGGKPYFVIDDRNVRSLLLSNKVDGTTDKNPLRTAILHQEPKQIPIRPKGRIVYDNRIELLGWDIPKVVSRGDKFTVKMFYKVLQPVGGNWRVLFHFDGSLRFNGDHEPIKGRCQTSTWQPGDYIVDTHTVTAGGGAFAPGRYDVWTGFFTGSAPNWKNLTVSEAPADMRDNPSTDRVKITSIILD